MRTLTTLRLALATAALGTGFAPAAEAATFREDFGNVGGWSYGVGGEVIEAAGGHPGAWLHAPLVDTFAPQPRTTDPASPFTGDYRRRGVVGVGIDIQVVAVDFSAEDRPLSLILTNDRGTPADPADDCSAYLVGQRDIPVPGEGWRSFSFSVPSASPTLPEGWAVLEEHCQQLDADRLWNALIRDVDQLRYFFGDPTFFFIFQVWDVGLDSARVMVE